MNDPKVKQQISEKIKGSSNILVTVSNDPSVDELSAALGLTLLLNKMDKHATAVFSGHVPPAITFLDPEKTFEDTTDSLRDFIIALDKEKADHLRYKLEGDLVKIYITPYRTTITSDDLEFSQGDYNVELVIALGVENKDNLDTALSGHGKILHDAAVITLTAGEQTSNLGSIDWHDSNASSLSEMLASLYDSMKPEKSLLDQPIATAWLTGIVAATERFSNTRTTSRVMTLAAQLMAAGADQQLIASKLAESTTDSEPSVQQPEPNENGETKLTEGEPTKLTKTDETPDEPKPKRDGELAISHERDGTIEQVAEEVGAERLEAAARAAERALEKHEETQEAVPAEPPVPRGPVAYTPPAAAPAVSQLPTEPTFGGTLNATSEQAEEDKRHEIADEKNKVILSHSYIGNGQPTFNTPINSVDENQEQTVDLFGSNSSSSTSIEPPSAPTLAGHDLVPPSEERQNIPSQDSAPQQAAGTPTLADLDAQNRVPHDDARVAIDAAFAAGPSTPEALADFGIPLPPPPPLPTDFSGGLPPLPPSSGLPPERLGDIFAPEQAPPATFDTQPSVEPVPNTDPGQFRIPGQ